MFCVLILRVVGGSSGYEISNLNSSNIATGALLEAQLLADPKPVEEPASPMSEDAIEKEDFQNTGNQLPAVPWFYKDMIQVPNKS